MLNSEVIVAVSHDVQIGDRACLNIPVISAGEEPD